MKEVHIFLNHMLESMDDIQVFMEGVTKEHFLRNKEKQNAVIRSIEVIGEAVKNLPEHFRKQHVDIPWVSIPGMRDRLIHHYFGVNLERVWLVVKNDIPSLKKKNQRLDVKK